MTYHTKFESHETMLREDPCSSILLEWIYPCYSRVNDPYNISRRKKITLTNYTLTTFHDIEGANMEHPTPHNNNPNFHRSGSIQEHLVLILSSWVHSTQLYLKGAIESILHLYKSWTFFKKIKPGSMKWRELSKGILSLYFYNLPTSKSPHSTNYQLDPLREINIIFFT